MSCEKCSTAQENPIDSVYYIRVGTGNVMLVGCEDHVGEAMERIRGD